MRWFLLWLRREGCFHEFVTSKNRGTLGMPMCPKCGAVWFSSGERYGHHTENDFPKIN